MHRLGKWIGFEVYPDAAWAVFLLLLLCLGQGCKDRNNPFRDLIGEDADWSRQGEFQTKVSTYEDDDRHIGNRIDHQALDVHLE